MTHSASVGRVRVVALLGVTVWAIGAVFVLVSSLAGAANFAAPSVYIVSLVALGALVLNALLFRNAETAGRRTLIGLAALSMALSMLILSLFAYVTFDLGAR